MPFASLRLLSAALVLMLGLSGARAAGYSDIIIDVNSGKVLHETNPDAERYPASLTKMMTLYVTFDMIEKKRLALDTILHISEYGASAQPSKLGLRPGDTISVRDSIKALVTASANDVARTIAENLGTDEEKFAKYMTWQAKKLGMKDTVFKNASGLPHPGQHTTARDYATLSLRLWDDFPQHFAFFKTPYFQWGRARYRNHNGLLFNYPGSDGIKTGYIRASGFNLAESVHRGRKHLIGVIFGGRSARERNAKMRALLNAALPKAAVEKTRARSKYLPGVAVAAVSEKPKAKPAKKQVAEVAVETQQPQPETGRSVGAIKGSKALKKLFAEKPAPKAQAEAEAEVAPAAAPAAMNPLPGPYHVQIGAYPTEAEAHEKLSVAMGSASGLLKGHVAGAVAYNGDDRVWYRARFAGFQRAAADKTCSQLKTKHLQCIVMSAN